MIVIFDLEGVLTDTDACRFGSWERMAKEQGIGYDRALDDKLRGLPQEEALQTLLRGAHRSYSAAERLALLARRNDLFDEILEDAGEKILLPEADEVLRQLRRYGCRIGAASGDVPPGRILASVPQRRRFDVISRKEGLWVQLLDIQERLQTQPTECLVVSAGEEAVQSAQALGMQTLRCEAKKGIGWQALSAHI